MRTPGAQRALLACVAGLAQAASLAWPGNGQPLWWLQILSFVAFAALLLTETRAVRAGALAWLFATSWLTGTFWWLFTSLHTYGGLAAPLTVLAIVGLAVFLASYYALAGALFAAFRPKSRLGSAALLAGLWLLAELTRNTLWTGFPWGAGGYAHTGGPLAALARWTGVYGLGFVATFIAVVLAGARARDLRSPSAWLVVLILSLGLWGAHAGRSAALAAAAAPLRPPLTLALLQGNIPQDEKFQPGSGVPLALNWYAQELKNARADLVVAPETALPLLPQQLPPGYLEAIEARYASGAQAALVGVPMGDLQQGYTNSVLGFRPDTAPYRYDKHHLVPFGEFVPPMFRWFINLMHIPLGDFARGPLAQPSFEWHGERIAPNICYEDLFGDEIAAHFQDAAAAPTILLNLSNIAWFGTGLAIDQHLQISRMRTLEFERPMVRATNTGATAVIAADGRITYALERATRGVLLAQVQGLSGPLTPFAWWASRWRLWPLWLLGTLCLCAAVMARRMRVVSVARGGWRQR